MVPARVLELVAASQSAVPSRLGGGAALSGVHLGHRLSRDIDLFFDDKRLVRELLVQLGELAAGVGATFKVVRDGGAFVRGVVELPEQSLEVDLVYEPSQPLAPRDIVANIVVDSLPDLRANKLTCLLSRSEPRDLVDVMFLERSGYTPEKDLELALAKDAGVDPGILAHLLSEFPVTPLPQMLVPLSEAELVTYRNELSERLRRLAVAPGT
ncbi:MAG TPA: nucleotidyl transferase AbiEii/AbiGii toxin family protein [Polyangiaceae bacterium]|nr:nucleotidyl transferase AbiEii/AbiGii toxin family protein [Polyangiaceae bacterium]